MKELTRRDFLKAGVAVTGAAILGGLESTEAMVPEEPQAAVTQMRYSCFYQVDATSIAYYQDPTYGLPNDAGHIHVFAHSHATPYADSGLANTIHAGGPSFKYAPAFDLGQHVGWYSASDSQLASWGRAFRDAAIAAGADYFSFNELPTSAPSDSQVRVQVMTLLYYLNEPDAWGRRLRGIFFMTEASATPGNWTSTASSFWQRVNDTCDLVVAEHYHAHRFICDNTEAWLSDHFFAMRDWLNNSGEAAKTYIANNKFTVLHSSRYAPGDNGWHGGDSTVVSLAEFQRNLSKCAKVTRNRAGGYHRIAFGPITSSNTSSGSYTDPRVHPRIRLLINWHYNQGGSSLELACVQNYQGNCQC